MSKTVRTILDAAAIGFLAVAAWCLCSPSPRPEPPRDVTPSHPERRRAFSLRREVDRVDNTLARCTIATHIETKEAFYITDKANAALDAFTKFCSNPTITNRDKVDRAIVDILTFRKNVSESVPL